MDLTNPTMPECNVENDKTESEATKSAIARLEKEIDGAYSLLESKFSTLWDNATRNAQSLQERIDLQKHKTYLMTQLSSAKDILSDSHSDENIHHAEDSLNKINEEMNNLGSNYAHKSLSQSANEALDNLDAKLEIVEKQAGKFVNSVASFFSGMVAIKETAKETSQTSERTTTTPHIPGAAYGTSRYDSELFKLHTSEDIYLSDDRDLTEEIENFDVSRRTDEITQLLQKYSETLPNLMNNLVPLKLSYKSFWFKYFKHEMNLKFSEKARKELLNSNENSLVCDGKIEGEEQQEQEQEEEEEEEEFTWDDEEEDSNDISEAVDTSENISEK